MTLDAAAPSAATPTRAPTPTRSASGRFVAKPEPKPKQKPKPVAAAAATLALFFLRHADAGDPMAWVGDDADRPLSGKGRKQAKRLGRLLREVDVVFDACISSPRRRAADTAKLVAKAIGRTFAIEDRLGQDFDDAALSAIVADLDPSASSVMLVGHDPDFSRTVSWLVGTSIELRKGALAVIDLPGRTPGAGRGSLRWLLPPDAVPG
jgi:phosphohistidine phosphatase